MLRKPLAAGIRRDAGHAPHFCLTEIVRGCVKESEGGAEKCVMWFQNTSAALILTPRATTGPRRAAFKDDERADLAGRAFGGNRLGSRLRRCRGIPSAGRSAHGVRLVGLRLGCEGLNRKLRGCERLRIEPLGHIVTLAAGIRVALGGGKAEPLAGL